MGIQLQSASLPEHMKPLEAVKLFAKWNKVSLDKETLELSVFMNLQKNSVINYQQGKSGDFIYLLL